MKKGLIIILILAISLCFGGCVKEEIVPYYPKPQYYNNMEDFLLDSQEMQKIARSNKQTFGMNVLFEYANIPENAILKGVSIGEKSYTYTYTYSLEDDLGGENDIITFSVSYGYYDEKGAIIGGNRLLEINEYEQNFERLEGEKVVYVLEDVSGKGVYYTFVQDDYMMELYLSNDSFAKMKEAKLDIFSAKKID